MDYKQLKSNLIAAFMAQGIALGLSFVTSLLMPKILGVEQFGYWQLFLLYCGYSGLFHFGVNDGVYLLNGGKTRDELDNEDLAAQLRVSTFIQLVLLAIVVVVVYFNKNITDKSFLFIAAAVYTVVYNGVGFFGFIFQSVNETKLYSFVSTVNLILFLIPAVLLIVFKVDVYEPYVVSYIFGKFCTLLICIYKGREIASARWIPALDALKTTWSTLVVGVKLTVANIAAQLILGIMRFVIEGVWGITTFSKVSFSLSMVSFVLMFVSQASMVLFPALRRTDESEQASFFTTVQEALSLILPISYLLYFPALVILTWWLPKYSESMHYFILLLPLCVFDGKMDLLGTTYLKVLRKEKLLLYINLACVLGSLAASFAGAYLFGSATLVVLFSCLIVVGRSIFTEIYITRQMGIKMSPMIAEELVITAVFMIAAYTLPTIWAAIVYLAAYAVFIFINRKTARNVLNMVPAFRKNR
jgi:O-antigen/teichoic acid export membrane protein